MSDFVEFKLDMKKIDRLRRSIYEVLGFLETALKNLNLDKILELEKEEKCPGCGYFSMFFYDHHIIPKVVGGLDQPSNIIRICTECHAKVHSRKNIGNSDLIKAGIAKARLTRKGWGKPSSRPDKAIRDLRNTGFSIRQIVKELHSMGYKISSSTVVRSLKQNV